MLPWMHAFMENCFLRGDVGLEAEGEGTIMHSCMLDAPVWNKCRQSEIWTEDDTNPRESWFAVGGEVSV